MTEIDSAIRRIALTDLRAHPLNANVMTEAALATLARHIEQTDRYPPLIVRPMPGEARAWQVLDGHHRWRALERLGRRHADCLVWPVDDEAALMLLATLNRLRGNDAPLRRAALIEQLHQRFSRTGADLSRHLPESADQIARLLSLRRAAPPPPRPPAPLSGQVRPIHFFLLPDSRRRLLEALARIGQDREAALMTLVDHYERSERQSPDDDK